MYAATEIGPVVYTQHELILSRRYSRHTVIASPSIFASGVDHFRSEVEDVDVDDKRIAHCVDRRSVLFGCEILHRVVARSN